MPRPVSNPPNPWASSHVEWLEEPPAATLEVYEEEAKSILAENDSPDIGFRYSLNPYRGCFHACAYCLVGDTQILMADGRTRALRDLRVGDEIYGTETRGGDRTAVITQVLAHWSTTRRAHRVSLASGAQIVTSGDHRFLTDRGWARVAESFGRRHLDGDSRLVRLADGVARSDADLRVTAVEPLGVDLPMFDITTGTGDFIANGVVSHNCYARPTHQYLGFGAGTDFDRKIVVKTNAPELLRQTFDKKSWQGELIAFSGDTDCYQPLEASYGLTRRCLEICAEYQNPVGVITKSMVIRRDLDVLARLAHSTGSRVTVSIPFANDAMARTIEPYASPPSRRFETLKMLSDAGIKTGIAIAPIIPGLNDPDIPELLERAREAGAQSAFIIMLRLPREVLPVFRERIARDLPPERVRKIEHAIQEIRGGDGKMNDASFGGRFRGQGERWRAIETLFELHARRLGFERLAERMIGDEAQAATFRRPRGQLTLF